MKKVFAVSVVGAACVFAANAGAEDGKSGFYLTGKAGASVVSLSDQRFLSGDDVNAKIIGRFSPFLMSAIGH